MALGAPHRQVAVPQQRVGVQVADDHIGASVYDTWKSRDLLSAGDIPLFAVGTIFAFFSALACVHWLIRFVASNSFRVFAWYRVIFGLLILAVTYTGLLHWGSAMD